MDEDMPTESPSTGGLRPKRRVHYSDLMEVYKSSGNNGGNEERGKDSSGDGRGVGKEQAEEVKKVKRNRKVFVHSISTSARGATKVRLFGAGSARRSATAGYACPPVCHRNCNCKACLRDAPEFLLEDLKGWNIDREKTVQYSKYLLHRILPGLKQLGEEQLMERKIEASMRGVLPALLEIQVSDCPRYERVYCDNCKTSVFDYHRSCPVCYSDLCLLCCREMRDGCLQGNVEVVLMDYVDRGFEYLHGQEEPLP